MKIFKNENFLIFFVVRVRLGQVTPFITTDYIAFLSTD